MLDRFERTELDGKVRVLSEKLEHLRSVCLGIWVKVGARDEAEGISGLSHFIEHMIFKGTEAMTALDISKHFDSLGAEINAFSSKEYTCYYVRVLDDHVDSAFKVLSDIVQRPAFRKDDLASEREVVLEEISLYEDTPDDRIHDLVIGELWPDHALGNRVLGFSASVSSISREAVQAYFDSHYTQSNIVIAAVGNIEHEHLVDLARNFFCCRTGEPVNRTLAIPEVTFTERLFYKDTEQAHICLAMPGLSAHDDERFELSIMDVIFGSGMSSRLFQRIREREGLAYSVYSYSSGYTETGVFAVYAGTRPANAQRVIDMSVEELQTLAAAGINNEELERSKNHLIGQLVISMESTSSRMSRLGKNELLGVEFLTLEDMIKRIDAIEIARVNDLARRICDLDRCVLSVIGPFREGELAISRGD